MTSLLRETLQDSIIHDNVTRVIDALALLKSDDDIIAGRLLEAQTALLEIRRYTREKAQNVTKSGTRRTRAA